MPVFLNPVTCTDLALTDLVARFKLKYALARLIIKPVQHVLLKPYQFNMCVCTQVTHTSQHCANEITYPKLYFMAN